MAWIFNGKHFGGYTFEHWFDEDDTGSGADEKTGGEQKGGGENPPMENFAGTDGAEERRDSPQGDLGSGGHGEEWPPY
jgi:hypothetical protein